MCTSDQELCFVAVCCRWWPVAAMRFANGAADVDLPPVWWCRECQVINSEKQREKENYRVMDRYDGETRGTEREVAHVSRDRSCHCS